MASYIWVSLGSGNDLALLPLLLVQNVPIKVFNVDKVPSKWWIKSFVEHTTYSHKSCWFSHKVSKTSRHAEEVLSLRFDEKLASDE